MAVEARGNLSLRLIPILALALLTIPLAADAAGTALAPQASCGATFPRMAELPEGEAPVPEGCRGKIRPGAQMTSPAGCTYSFVLTDATGNLYIGTAAHCVRLGDRVSTSTPIGAFGTVISDGALGVDYALIRIDDSKKHLVDPELCTFGGPIGPDPGNRPTGDALLEYAWGSVNNAHETVRGRALIELDRSASTLTWIGYGSGGDSGGPVISIEGYAVASHTFGITPLAGVVGEGGPTFARMLASGRTVVPTLTLVTAEASSLSTLARDLP